MAKKHKAPPRKKADSRWITVQKPFNYHWPSRAVTHWSVRDLGQHRVKNEVADFAVAKGYAVEGKLEEQGAAEAADDRPDNGVAQPDLVDADRPADREPLDPDAE